MQYYVAVFRPEIFDHALEITDKVMADIDQLNDEMVAAGIRLFVGGFKPLSTAKSITLEANGSHKITAGPHVKSTSYVDGFWVLELASDAEALEWGKKAAAACRGPVEIRPFHE